MTTLQEQTVRKALQGLFPTVLIDLTVEYLPRVIFHSWWLLQFLSKGPVTLQQDGKTIKVTPTNFEYADIYGFHVRENGWWRIWNELHHRELDKIITLPILINSPVPILDKGQYKIEIDPDRQIIISIDGNPLQ